MKRVVMLVTVFLVLTGCNTSRPLYNVKNAAVTSGSGSPVTMVGVRRAIVLAATQKGWVMKEMGAGRLQATINVRKHMAQVLIAYTPRSYSITYQDSHTLEYDGATIHRNYNKWIRKLEGLINSHLSRL